MREEAIKTTKTKISRRAVFRVSKRVLHHRCLFKFQPRRTKKIQARSKKAANRVTGALVTCGEINIREDEVWGVVSGVEELNLVQGGR
ncbi:hypothetical protein QC763_302760 [Podospora pseudopauciseta]|uniref:Uncharacterized protein n=1 Tax=Podospora pseudopauciseta TaxID=2093780 RepID=A0ABR0HF70_9PEZI|nr:hypothetical protein QC763_302760 [Podospora pseudopauciseta]